MYHLNDDDKNETVIKRLIKKHIHLTFIEYNNDLYYNKILIYFGLENEDNKEIIEEYKRLYKKDNRKPPLQTLDRKNCPENNEDFGCGLYYVRPPEVDEIHPSSNQEYCNGVSICFYLRHNRHSIWIAGDITPDVHEAIIEGKDIVERRFSYLGKQSKNKDIPDNFNLKTSMLNILHGTTFLRQGF